MKTATTLLFLALSAVVAHAEPLSPVPYRVVPAMPDVLQALDPSAVRLGGWIGARVDANVRDRLEVVDTVPLLAGYIRKPGEQAWIGEHVGKWLHAATLAWAYTGDEALRRKLDAVAAQLIATQEPDGYLGTYVPSERFGLYPGADWDVWSHAYNMIGLLTYYRYTGNKPALESSRRIADLLIRTFPGKRSILAAGTHDGLASTSVLEPVVELYRLTGDERYLAFAKYVVGAYDEPGGPGLVRSLLAGTDVSRIADGKAYEMMANLMGLCDLAKVTGDRRMLEAVTDGWGDIVRNHLYVTGTSSTHECFAGDHELPDGQDAKMGETCVTTTWIQLNLQLLQLTGGAAYADEIERSLYNHLAAAQNPRGDDWCYYTPLEGSKHYDKGITCCHSSGPRAMALAPSAAYLQSGGTIYVDTLETSRAQFLIGGRSVGVEQQSGFPREGRTALVVRLAQPARFGIAVRVPGWAAPMRIDGTSYAPGWAMLPERSWNDGDRIEINFGLQGRVIPGDHARASLAAVAWGPFVLAADSARNPGLLSLDPLRLAGGAEPALKSASGDLSFAVKAWASPGAAECDVALVPFADAGDTGGRYRVWLGGAH